MVAELAELHGRLGSISLWTLTSSAGGLFETTKDTYIPVFNNLQGYRGLTLTLQGEEKEAVINLLTSLQGTAWREVEHMVGSVTESSDGRMWLRCSALWTNSSTTLLSCCSERRELLREIEKNGIKIPDGVSG